MSLRLAVAIFVLASADGAAAQTIHLRLHAVRVSDDDGTRAADVTPAQVATWVKETNAVFGRSNAGIRLHFVAEQSGPDWQVIKSTTLNRLSSMDQVGWPVANAFAAQQPAKVVVFFRHGRDSLPTGNGFAFPPQSQKGANFIAMPGFNHTGVPVDAFTGPFVQNRVILAHELGHYLGLGHTFPGWSDTETDTDAEIVARIQKAGGKASALDGDSLSDTPAEAGTAYYKTKGWAMCSGPPSYTITGSAGKAFSLTFTPVRTNIMSYFVCGAMWFTPGQINRMRQTLALPVRKGLVGWEPPYDLVTKPAPEAVAGKPLLPPVPIFVDSADQAKAPPTTTTRRRTLPPPPPPPPARSKPVPPSSGTVLLQAATLTGQEPPTRMGVVPDVGHPVAPPRPAPAVDIVAVNVVPSNFLADKPVVAGQVTKLRCVVYEYHPAGTDPAPLSWKGRVEAGGSVLGTFASGTAKRAEHVFDGDATMTSWSYDYEAAWTPAKPGWNETRCLVDTGNDVSEGNESNNSKGSKAWVSGPWNARLGDGPPPTATEPPGGPIPPARRTR